MGLWVIIIPARGRGERVRESEKERVRDREEERGGKSEKPTFV
jgi:hypothetical protein